MTIEVSVPPLIHRVLSLAAAGAPVPPPISFVDVEIDEHTYRYYLATTGAYCIYDITSIYSGYVRDERCSVIAAKAREILDQRLQDWIKQCETKSFT